MGGTLVAGVLSMPNKSKEQQDIVAKFTAWLKACLGGSKATAAATSAPKTKIASVHCEDPELLDDFRTCPTCNGWFKQSTVGDTCPRDKTVLLRALTSQPSENSAALPQGSNFGGYELKTFLGSGTMSSVYRAYEAEHQREIVIKVLRDKLCDDGKTKTRFTEAAKKAIVLDGEKTVRIYDVGILPPQAPFSRRPFIAAEYVKGTSLAQYLREHKRMPVQQAIEMAIQTCEALEYAHARGVMHGALKPSNVLITDGPAMSIKIADFGLTERLFRKMEFTQVTDGSTASYFGNPKYTSPEAAKYNTSTPPSDMYVLGSVLYEALSGNPPFVGANEMQTLLMHFNEPVKPFSADLKVPAALEAIIQKMMAKEAKDRFESIAILRQTLQSL